MSNLPDWPGLYVQLLPVVTMNSCELGGFIFGCANGSAMVQQASSQPSFHTDCRRRDADDGFLATEDGTSS